MTLKIRAKSQFKKDLKKAARDPHKNTQLLKSIIDDYLIQNKTVPEHHPHVINLCKRQQLKVITY